MAKKKKSKSGVSARTEDQIRKRQKASAFVKRLKQKNTQKSFCIPRLPFSRVVRELLQEASGVDLRIQATALETLQCATESWMTRMFEDSYMCALHAKRVTLMIKDLELARKLRRYKT
eukprot:UN01858